MSQKPLDKITDVGALRILVALLRAENDQLRELLRRRDQVESKANPQESLPIEVAEWRRKAGQ